MEAVLLDRLADVVIAGPEVSPGLQQCFRLGAGQLLLPDAGPAHAPDQPVVVHDVDAEPTPHAYGDSVSPLGPQDSGSQRLGDRNVKLQRG